MSSPENDYIWLAIIHKGGRVRGESHIMPAFEDILSDADIDAVVNAVFQTQSYDATTLSFDFTVSDPAATSISFDLVFGSDEYPEWVDQFVDCAIVLVNGHSYVVTEPDDEVVSRIMQLPRCTRLSHGAMTCPTSAQTASRAWAASMRAKRCGISAARRA